MVGEGQQGLGLAWPTPWPLAQPQEQVCWPQMKQDPPQHHPIGPVALPGLGELRAVPGAQGSLGGPC